MQFYRRAFTSDWIHSQRFSEENKGQIAPCFNVSLWWQSTLTGMGLTLLCSIFLVKIARGYQRQADPTKVFSAEAEPNK